MTYLCQRCRYRYDPEGSDAARKDMFCSCACAEAYLVKHKRLPRVSAEIPLGEPELFNLGTCEMPEIDDETKKAILLNGVLRFPPVFDQAPSVAGGELPKVLEQTDPKDS